MSDPGSLCESKWFVCFPARPSAAFRLFCVPAAGSGPAIFRDWHRSLPECVEVVAIQQPGRGSRVRDPAFTQMSSLVVAIADELSAYSSKPFALFGHSLGALICFELARELSRRSLAPPLHLFVASCRPPHHPIQGRPAHLLPEEEFVRKLRQGNGVPENVLASPSLMELFLPVLRADAELGDTYVCDQRGALDCPITAFIGRDDPAIGKSDISEWSEQSRRTFSLQRLAGDHFISSQAGDLLICLHHELAAHLDQLQREGES